MNTLRYCLFLSIFALLQQTPAMAQSKRVHVYQLTQQYWDVRSGESLSEIAKILLPADHSKQQILMRDIVNLNPDAFINANPHRLLANKRLWLPNTIQKPITNGSSKNNSKREFYSWGSIKRVQE